MTSNDISLLQHCGGIENNSLGHILKLDDEGFDENEIEVVKHSSYFDDDSLYSLLEQHKDKFCILSTNIQSMNAKFDELEVLIDVLRKKDILFDAICIQESWLEENDDTSRFQLHDFSCITQGKSCSLKGGLIIYLNNKYRYSVKCNFNSSNIWEGQFIEIYSSSLTKKILLGNVYRPPNDICENYNTFTKEFLAVINNIEHSNKEFILAGDTNINLLKVNDKEVINNFYDAITSQSFFPKITLPTRFSNTKGTLIDNMFYKLSDVTMDAISGIMIKKFSDHQPYFMCANFNKQKVRENLYVAKKYNKCDHEKFRDEIKNANINTKLDSNPSADPNANYNLLNNTLINAKKKHLPLKLVKFNKHKHKKSKWITKGIIKSIAFRDKMYQRFRKTQPHSQLYLTLKTNLATYNAILKNSICAAKKSYYESCFKKYKDDIRKTWSTINEVLCKNRNKKKFPEFFKYDGKEIRDN